MTQQQLTSRLRKVLEKNVQYLAADMKRDILDAFEKEFGYGPRFCVKRWRKLADSTIATREKFGYGSGPKLFRSGRLRDGIDVRYDKSSGVLRTGNFSRRKTEKLYSNDKPIPEKLASQYLSIVRPHTEPPAKYHKPETLESYLFTDEVIQIIEQFLLETIKE